MRLSDIGSDDSSLFEAIPNIGNIGSGAGVANTTPATGVQGADTMQSTQQDAARAAQDRQAQIRQTQEQIRQTEQQLIALRKQLSELQR